MTHHSLSTRIVVGVCAAVFLAASGAGPPDFHACPHHDGAHDAVHGAGRGSADHRGDGAEAHAGSSGVDASDHGRSHEDGGPCTCVGDCHASADMPAPPSADARVAAAAAGEDGAGALTGEGSLLGPRHALFALHLPNAPPASL